MRDLVIADKSEIVNIADAVRSLTGSTTTMNLSGMKSHLNTTKTSIDNAFAAIADKGVTVPDGSTSDALAGLIASIDAGGGGGAFVVGVHAAHGSGTKPQVFDTFTIDKTGEEINAAYAAGMPIVVKFSSGGGSFLLHLFGADDGYYYFYGIQNTYNYMGGKFQGSVKLFSMAIIQSSGTVERAESETIYTRS